MKKAKYGKILFIIAAFLILPAASSAQNIRTYDLPGYGRLTAVEDELIVKFRQTVPENKRKALHASHRASVRRKIPAIGAEKIKVPPGQLEKVLSAYKKSGLVEYAEPNGFYSLLKLPREYTSITSMQNAQWGLVKINAHLAWDIETGEGAVIAIIDDGIQIDHPDLAANIWINPNEVSDGTDTDDNGFIDDVYGWNFAEDNNLPFPFHAEEGHGTHVAGIAAAAENGFGVVGASWGNRIMSVKALKYMVDDVRGSWEWIADSIIYAADNGADIINMSLGGNSFSDLVADAVSYAYNSGCLLVAASGNDNGGVSYPAAYTDVIAVGSSDSFDSRSDFSNYGPELDLLAPGEDIRSTLRGDGYGNLNGTSMAAPFVSGAASLAVSYWMRAGVEWAPYQLRQALIESCDDIGAPGWDMYTGHGRLNAFGLMESIVLLNPDQFSGEAISDTSVRWSWEEAEGAEGYRIRSAASPSTILAELGEAEWVEEGLSPDSLYERFVTAAGAVWESGASDTASARTNATAPSGLTAVSVSSVTVGLAWDREGSPEWTRFELSLSTDAGFAVSVSTPIALEDSHTHDSELITGLLPETTYHFRVRAFNGEAVPTAFTSLSVRTWYDPETLIPVNFTGDTVSETSIAWSWDAIGAAGGYRVVASTDQASVIADLGPVTEWAETGLLPDHEYSRAVLSVVDGWVSAASDTAAAWTLARAPTGLEAVSVHYNAAELEWYREGNPEWTRFEVSLSTDPGFAVNVSTPVGPGDNHTSGSALIGGLLHDTTYYFRVRAYNGAGLSTGFSETSAKTRVDFESIVITGLTGEPLSETSIMWSWEEAPHAEGYRVSPSTDHAAVLAATGSPWWEETGLAPDHEYSRAVTAFGDDWDGEASGAAPAWTLAAEPSGLEVAAVSSSTAELVWNRGANPGWTRFGLGFSTDEEFIVGVSTPVAFNDNSTAGSAVVGGLLAETTYYFRVWAYNSAGMPTGYTSAGVRTWYAPETLVPADVTGEALSGSALMWSWDQVGPAEGYRVRAASDPETVKMQLDGTVTEWEETGLSPDYEYSRVITAFGEAWEGDESDAAAARTHAEKPAALVLVSISTGTAEVSWSRGANPSWTQFGLSFSTDEGFAVNVSTPYSFGDSLKETSALITGLTHNTEYFIRARAYNTEGVPTGFTDAVQVRTLFNPDAYVLSGFSGEALSDNALRWSWTGGDPATGYRIMDAADPSAVLAEVTNEWWEEAGLSPDHEYSRVVAAFGDGWESGASGAAASRTRASVPDGLEASAHYTSAELSWSRGGNPEWTRFGVSISASEDFAVIVSTPVSFDDNHVSAAAVLDGLESDTTYYFRVRAYNAEGVPTGFAEVSARTLSDYEIFNISFGYGGMQSHLKISPGAFDFMPRASINPPEPAQLDAASAADSKLPQGSRDIFKAMNYVILDEAGGEVDYSQYPDAEMNIRFNFPPHLTRPEIDSLRIMRLDESARVWVWIQPAEISAAERWIQAAVSRLSVFKLVSSPYAGVSEAYVYPNPLIPGDSVYGGADRRPGIVFGRLPENATIRIYDLSGEFIKELKHSSGSVLRWEGAETVASGVYISVITAPGSDAKIQKFAVIR